MSKYKIEKTDDVHVCMIHLPFDLLDAIYGSLSDVMMKRIVDFRTYGDEQQSRDYFDLHIEMTRLLRDWETNARSPF